MHRRHTYAYQIHNIITVMYLYKHMYYKAESEVHMYTLAISRQREKVQSNFLVKWRLLLLINNKEDKWWKTTHY